jgi:phytanoyl-CoA hydroxylase
MNKILSPAQLEAFRQDGFLVVERFFDESLVARALADVRAFFDEKRHLEPGVHPKHIVEEVDGAGVKYAESIDHYVPSIRPLLSLKLLAAAGEILDQDTHLFVVELHDKVPRQGTVTPPHQDNFYFCLDPPDALTVYVPLELHGRENGGLCYVRGSHRLGTLDHRKSKVKAFSSELLGLEPGEQQVYPLQMKPGDVVFHHANTVHFAPRNPSELHRRSLSIRINGVRAQVSQAMRERYQVNRAFNRDTPVQS